MKMPCRLATVAGTVEVAEEMLTAVKEIFGDAFVGTPFLLSEITGTEDVDLFLCFFNRVSEVAKKVPPEKIVSLDMVPTPRFFVKMATISPDQTRCVFCNTRDYARVIVDSCRQHDLPVDDFVLATYEDMPPAELVATLRQAAVIVGVAGLVNPGGVLHTCYGAYLRPDVQIVPVERLVTTKTIAALHKRLTAFDRLHEEKSEVNLNKLKAEIAERKKSQEQLEYELCHDSLTDLFNRRYFDTAAKRLAKERHAPVGIFVIDMDGLKGINDIYGHLQGDVALKEVAAILRRSFRPSDIVARFGGDEFAALVTDAAENEIKSIYEEIRRLVNEWAAREGRFPVSLSVGYALATNEYVPIRQLLAAADSAMYQEKLGRQVRA